MDDVDSNPSRREVECSGSNKRADAALGRAVVRGLRLHEEGVGGGGYHYRAAVAHGPCALLYGQKHSAEVHVDRLSPGVIVDLVERGQAGDSGLSDQHV